jgi:hypothetical protein
MAANEMLEKFLRKWKKKREVDGRGNGGVQGVDEVRHFLVERYAGTHRA